VKRFWAPAVCLFLLLIAAAVWFGLKANEQAIWTYNYRDESGNIVFVTKKFDLILQGRSWSNSDSIISGDGTLMIGGQAGLILGDKGPRPVLKENGRLEFSFPGISVTLLKGQTLQVENRSIPLRKDRVQVVVSQTGAVSVTNAPVSEFVWDSLDYIRQLSARFNSNTKKTRPASGVLYCQVESFEKTWNRALTSL
jgi:hypothetical protein